MSDYLARLIARERGDAPMLQPRLASRFEQAEAPADIQADAIPAPALAMSPLPALPALPPDAHAMHAEPVLAGISSAPAPLARQEHTPASTTPTTMERRVVVENTIRGTRRAPRAPSNEPVHSMEAATVPTRVSPERRGVLVEERPPSAKRHDESVLPVTSAGPSAPQRHFALPARPDVASAAHRAGRELAPSMQTDAGPVIHVSIGRIEVRAAHGSPRPAAPRAAPAASRLDAYLQQRDAGAKP
jgi:hypothetical protein